MKMHPSIINAGGRLESSDDTPFQLGCPLCPRFQTSREKTKRRHLDAHIRNAVRLSDTIICRCNLPCRDSGHYHCPRCTKTIMRKEDLTVHVTGCQNARDTPPGCDPGPPPGRDPGSPPPSDEVTAPSAAREVSARPATPVLPEPHSEPPTSTPEGSAASVVSADHSYTLHPLALPVGVDHSYTLSPSASPRPPAVPPQSPSASPPSASESPAAPPETTEFPSSRAPYLKSVKCPRCPLVLYKKNLSVHLQRKHSGPKDTCGRCGSKGFMQSAGLRPKENT